MASQSSTESNPFTDAGSIITNQRKSLTLQVGRDESLSLDEAGITVTDDHFDDSNKRCCGLLPSSEPVKTVPYFYVLDASLSSDAITIKYAKPKSVKKNAHLLVRTLIYHITPNDHARSWVDTLLDKAYGIAQRNKRIKVLVNPFGGAGKAPALYRKLVAPIFEASACAVQVEQTDYSGHAREIAENMDIDAFDVLACASGDGLPMECLNGLGRKTNARQALRNMAVVQLPCGTGNAMSWNLNGTGEPSRAAVAIVKGVRQPLDLASITQGDQRTLSFLSQSLGVAAESDLGTENIRWMGDFRFAFGFLVRSLGKTLYPIEYAVKTEIEHKDQIRQHYATEKEKYTSQNAQSREIQAKEDDVQPGLGLPPLKYGTINDPLPKDGSSSWTQLESYHNLGNFYCGNMCFMAADAPFFPASLPNDGMLDLMTFDGDITRTQALKLLLSVEKGTVMDEDFVRFRKISAVRVLPKYGSEEKPGYFSVDGEKLPFKPFQVEVHKGLGTTLIQRPGLYEHDGLKGPLAANSNRTGAAGTNGA